MRWRNTNKSEVKKICLGNEFYLETGVLPITLCHAPTNTAFACGHRGTGMCKTCWDEALRKGFMSLPKRKYKIKYRLTADLLDHKKFKTVKEIPKYEAIIEATSEYEAIGLLYVEKVGNISITEFGEME